MIMSSVTVLRRKYQRLARVMDERSRRIWAGTEACAAGWGGVSLVAKATGMARNTVAAGVRELTQRGGPEKFVRERVRGLGGGRKRLVEQEPKVLEVLEALAAPSPRSVPGAPLHWTGKSTRRLAKELRRMGYEVSDRSVASLLRKMGYRLHASHRTEAGALPPDHYAQFEYINRRTLAFQKRGHPVICVDAQKRQSSGDFTPQAARKRHPRPRREAVPLRGFEHLSASERSASVAADHDTAEFAVETIRRWWRKIGCRSYPRARELLIVADADGSHGNRLPLPAPEIQRLADQARLKVSICHVPSGTSRWHALELKVFACIAERRGRLQISHQVSVSLIGTTAPRRKIEAPIHPGGLPRRSPLQPAAASHGWNYTISPRAL